MKPLLYPWTEENDIWKKGEIRKNDTSKLCGYIETCENMEAVNFKGSNTNPNSIYTFTELLGFNLDDYLPHIGWLGDKSFKNYSKESTTSNFLHDTGSDPLFEFSIGDKKWFFNMMQLYRTKKVTPIGPKGKSVETVSISMSRLFTESIRGS